MRLVFPSSEYEERAKAFVQEFKEDGSEVNGSGGLDDYLEKTDYQDWLKKVLRDIDVANVPPERVPAFTYFFVDDSVEGEETIIGMINIRLCLNDFLFYEGGHIGYSIRPSKRGHGYGSEMLRQALQLCNRIGLNQVLIICDYDNYASSGVIKHCGGVLENERYSDVYQTKIQRYWILMKETFDKNGKL